MLRKLWCWLIGIGCEWKTTHSSVFKQQAYGVFINSEVPVVTMRRVEQQCATCGQLRTQHFVLGYFR